MPERRIAGVFASAQEAGRAREQLLRSGIPEDRIVLSLDLSRDAIAAEAPGQSYSNQIGQPPRELPEGDHADRVRAGGCVLTVRADSREQSERLSSLLREQGARLCASTT